MTTAVFNSHYSVDPFVNMAFDEWMFQQALDTPDSVYLRAYTWNTGTITFGYSQNALTAFDHDQVGNTPVIRRITGGRALFHDPSELTYAIAVNQQAMPSGPLTGTLVESSFSISRILVRFLESLGISSQFVRQSPDADSVGDFFHKAPCFESHSKYEVIAGGRKVVASAQRRIGPAMLQHGSIKLNGIAEHPALNINATNTKIERSLEPMARARFDFLAHRLKSVFAEETGLVFSHDSSDFPSDAMLVQRITYVRKNNMTKRDTIKQETG